MSPESRFWLTLISFVIIAASGYHWSDKLDNFFGSNTSKGSAAEVSSQGNSPTPVGAVQEVQPRGNQKLSSFDEREHITGHVRKLTAAGAFSQLEAMAESMRANDERTKDGWAKLTSFYDGTNSALLDIARLYGSEAAESQLVEWTDAYPESVTPLVARAHYEIKVAWAARSGKAAINVRTEQWSLFADKLKKAVETLTTIAEMEDKFDPAGHSLWFTVGAAISLPRDQMEELLLTGIEKYPSYEGLYRGMAFYLLPQWKGSPGDVEKFADEVWEALPEPYNDFMYARIAGFFFNYKSYNFFEDTAFPYPKLHSALMTLIKNYPEGVSAKKLLCYLAALADDRQTALALFNELGEWTEKDIEEYWRNRKRLDAYHAWATAGGASPNQVTMLEQALLKGSLEEVKRAVKAGEDINMYFTNGNTPLITAIEKNYKEITNFLIASGADLGGRSRGDYSVAAQAVESENLEVLQLTIDNGLEVNTALAAEDWGLLHVAANYNRPKAAEFVLKIRGTNVDLRSADGSTPLMVAAVKNSTQCAEVLIKNGADVNATDNGNNSILHVAAYFGAAEVIKLLIDAGADPAFKSNERITALELAERRHQKAAAEALQAATGQQQK